MNCSKQVFVAVIAFFFLVGALPLQAGEIPPNLQIAPKGKPISGQGMIINIISDDPISTGSLGVEFVIVGTCKKTPFQIGPIMLSGLEFEAIDEAYVSQIYAPVESFMWPADCNPPEDLAGYAVTGFKDIYFLDDVISGEAILMPVIPKTTY